MLYNNNQGQNIAMKNYADTQRTKIINENFIQRLQPTEI